MARAKKVGVLTFHKCINYGSYWQARCLIEGLRRRGFEAELLDHDCGCVRRSEARCALQPKLPRRTPRAELRQYTAKTRKFAEAIESLPHSRTFSLHEPQGAPAYDAIVVGSDEVWNFRHPWYGSKPIFFGDGLSTERLVSYAASFGNHSAWDGIHPHWAGKLGRFDALSVRDENSWHLVKNGTDREPAVVLDPCLQFADAIQAQPVDREPYALVYGHGLPRWLARSARRWSRRAGIRLVSIGYSNEWADEQAIDAGPADFVSLVAGARAVITNFFHGCVFALANGKAWVTVPSDYRSIKIPDLALMLGAQQRIVNSKTPEREVHELLETPVSTEVADRIVAHRERSAAFLDEALS